MIILRLKKNDNFGATNWSLQVHHLLPDDVGDVLPAAHMHIVARDGLPVVRSFIPILDIHAGD